jgi:hypothetical protein
VLIAVILSSHAAAARPVRLELRTTISMQCGWPGPEIDVVFPSAERLPAAIPRSAVLVDGEPATAASRSGRTVSLALARPQVLCDVIGPAVVRVTFARAAGIGNPARPGAYRVEMSHGSTSARGAFTVR